jgi:mannose-6-phosphate isomerase-like protein (cupin superfamily)
VRGFVEDIEALTEENRDYRRVLHTGAHLQLVVMALQPGEDLGEEVHEHTDQFFRVEEGKGEVTIDGQTAHIGSDTAVIVPAGSRHNIRNTGHRPLRMYTLYAPPEHPGGTVHHTRVDAAIAGHSAE